MSFSIQELAEHLGGQITADCAVQLSDIAPLEMAERQHLSYVESRKQLPAARKSQAGALLVTANLAPSLSDVSARTIIVDDPQKSFIQAMLLFRPPRPRFRMGISTRATVDPSAQLGIDCNVFPGAQVGRDVVIGDRCDIGPGVVIGDGCRIGDDCVLHANVVLYADVDIRNRVIIHSGAVIGADGFGYRFENGAFHKIPHTGTVVIEDDVEIGACATIDRGMIRPTVIGQGTKLDNQVMVAHNCRVGKYNALASQVGLAGSVSTGDYVQMGGQVGVADHVQIGSQIKIGGQAGVINDLPEPGVYHDSPARPEKEAIKTYLSLQKVPGLRDQVKRLQAQVVELEEQLRQLSISNTKRPAA